LFNSSSRLATLNKPTLVITGEKDKTVPFENQRMLLLKISGARQVLIPDASHAITIDQAERFNSVLLEFLTHST
jgi:pimeloyl-ACP methyl ester carboxylesterase